MNGQMIISITYNVSLLLALSIIYTIMPVKKVLELKGLKSIIIGCIVGFVGIAIMANPFTLAPGIVFDVRSVLISMSGIFIGAVPTFIGVLITALFRITQGGAGMYTGVAVIILSAALGLIWRRFRLPTMVENKHRRWKELYLFGLITHVGMLACMLVMPWGTAMNVLQHITIPVLAIYPIGTVLLGLLLFSQIDRSNAAIVLEQGEQRYRSLFENIHTVMLLINPIDGKVVDANPAACKYYGWSKSEMKNKKIYEIDILSDSEIKEKKAMTTMQGKEFLRFKHQLASGEIRDVEVHNSAININGQVLRHLVVHDVSQRVIAQKKLLESEQRLKVTLLSVGDGVIATDKDGRITLINTVAANMTGYAEAEAVGQPLKDVYYVIDENTKIRIEERLQKMLNANAAEVSVNNASLVRKDGTVIPIADSAAPIKNNEGKAIGAILVVRDVTEERKYLEEINYLAFHDVLTGLYNRGFFDEEVKRLDTKRNLPMTVIVGDVNGLKLTNDAFGHAVGDELLKRMAAELKRSCREDDIVARWGGDEYIMFLPQTDAKAALQICDRIKERCASVTINDMVFSISLGYETKTTPDQNIQTVIKTAEDYMYRKKSTEGSSIRGNTINTILETLHEKNEREKEHSERVSNLSKQTGQAMGLSDKEVNELELAGLMHDIGKIAISEEILNKSGKLSKSEWGEIRKHPEIGYRILSASNSMAYIAQYVLKHHERMDAKGYPSAIAASDIPLQSRILSIADSYDAMTSQRTYREPFTKMRAIEELQKCAGTQFDEEIVRVFIDKVIK